MYLKNFELFVISTPFYTWISVMVMAETDDISYIILLVPDRFIELND